MNFIVNGLLITMSTKLPFSYFYQVLVLSPCDTTLDINQLQRRVLALSFVGFSPG